MSKLRIESVKICRAVDQDPDLSYLGEYSDNPEAVHIDRFARGGKVWERSRELRYFNLGTGDAEYIESDYKRAEAYNRGEWCMMGVWAQAEVIVNGTVQTIRSGGLWGIESDSDAAYFRTIAHDELSSLRDTLAQLGATKAQLSDAFHGIEDTEFVDR